MFHLLYLVSTLYEEVYSVLQNHFLNTKETTRGKGQPLKIIQYIQNNPLLITFAVN